MAYDAVKAYDDDTISFVTCEPSLLVNVIIFPVTEDDTYEALRSPSKYDAVRAYDAEVAVWAFCDSRAKKDDDATLAKSASDDEKEYDAVCIESAPKGPYTLDEVTYDAVLTVSIDCMVIFPAPSVSRDWPAAPSTIGYFRLFTVSDPDMFMS